MICRIALALTIAAISTGAVAQSSRKPTWDDLLKPYVVKTDPAIPLAPPRLAEPTQPTEVAVDPSELSTTLKDACVVKAISRLPNINGMRVTHSSYEFYRAEKQTIFGQIFVSIEINGHQAHYRWICGVSRDSGIIVLVATR